MKKIQKQICREELKSRIPGLFAYMEENDAGEFVLHKATDSLNGCYGKIIESIRLPYGLFVGDEVILEGGKVYSYRTIMSYYYQYKDELGESDNFIRFVNDGIGKVEIDLASLGLNEKDHDLVPRYAYIGAARNLYKRYAGLKILYDHYAGDGTDINTLEPDICCECLKYRRMGGDRMYNKIVDLMGIADEKAEKYLGYADRDSASINLNLNLTQSIHDIGYLSCYLNDWVGGDLHRKGELYTYGGNTYICLRDNHDHYDDLLMEFIFNHDGKDFQLVSESVSCKYITAEDPNGGLFKLGDGDDSEYVVSGSADSKLASLRRYKTYVNGRGGDERPAKDEDWLFFYRVGLVGDYTTINDDLGNIVSYTDLIEKGEKNATTNVDDLAAFGNIITGIGVDTENFTITFEYYLNVHLKAEKCEVTEDDDKKKYNRFDGFYADLVDRHHGVKYVETYNYEEGGELDDLVNGRVDGVTFAEYITPENDEKYSDFAKYAFSTLNSTVYYDRRLDTQTVSISCLRSDYEANVKNEVDYMYADVFKVNYLDGITYEPIVENEVRISRGNYAAFERHLKLAEIKSLDDMVDYQNSSFFNVQKVN